MLKNIFLKQTKKILITVFYNAVYNRKINNRKNVQFEFFFICRIKMYGYIAASFQ